MSQELKNIFSIVAVAGAWVGGIGVLFSILGFCFGMINAKLFRIGITWLAIADAGILAMLVALIFLIQETTLWIFTIAGAVLLIALTVFVTLVVRLYTNKDEVAAGIIEGTRRRIEF